MPMMISAPASAATVVIQPTARERVQPLHPKLASKDSDPIVKPRLMMVRGSDAAVLAMKSGAAGLYMAVSIVAATTVTMNETEETTAHPMVVVINLPC